MEQEGGPELHPMAPEHIPGFVAAPGEADILFTGTVVFVLVFVLILGNLYLRLHALPDRMAHRANHAQLQVVGILTLLALFTHNNLFWIAALLLAAIQLPDLLTPLSSMARSLRRLAARHEAEEAAFARDGVMPASTAGPEEAAEPRRRRNA